MILQKNPEKELFKYIYIIHITVFLSTKKKRQSTNRSRMVNAYLITPIFSVFITFFVIYSNRSFKPFDCLRYDYILIRLL